MTLRGRLALAIVLTGIPLVAGLLWMRKNLERQAVEEGMREFVLARMEAGDRERCEADPEVFGGRLRPGPGRGPRGRLHRPGGRGPGRDEHRFPPGPEGAGGPPPNPEDRRPPPRRGRGPIEPPLPGGGPRALDFELWAYDAKFESSNPDAPGFPAALRGDLEDGDAMAGSAVARGDRSGHQVAVRMRWTDGPCAIVVLRRFGPSTPSAVKDLLWGAAVLCGVLLLAVLLTAGPIVRRIRRLTSEVRNSAESRYAEPVTVAGSDEITDLSLAFNEAGAEVRTHIESLNEREQTLREFLANTTHDVMLPLTVLQGHLSIMRKRLALSEAVDAPLVGDALVEAHYMGSLLHNLSAVAKLEAGADHVRKDRVDLNALVDRATSRHRTMAQAKGVDINHAVPEAVLEVVGDVTLLEQAVSNLVHNAVRYNESGGHVAIRLEAVEGRFSIRVIDDGPGIPEAQLTKLPERRFRGAAARTRHPEGLGLGLHIARDVAVRHGFDLAMRRSSYGGLEVELSGVLA